MGGEILASALHTCIIQRNVKGEDSLMGLNVQGCTKIAVDLSIHHDSLQKTVKTRIAWSDQTS